MLPQCQAIMNTAVHTTTGQQPYFAFFSRHPPRLINLELPSVDGTVEGISEAHAIVKETHAKMARKYRAAANKARKNPKVEMGKLVWVKAETTQPNTCRKLNRKWRGPYRVVEVIRDGSAYILQNIFDGKEIQRAAEKVKVKPYFGSEEWLMGMQEVNVQEEEDAEPLPPRQRKAPHRYIEEC